MTRQIIKIDKYKCNGCEACVSACHEGAIAMVDGVAQLVREDYCDGLGNCLPVCPTGAITFEKQEVKEIKAPKRKQWPIQLKLVPINAPYFDGSDLVVAADCVAFSYPDFHEKFMKDNAILIGCPKLDNIDYSEKLTSIISNNNIKNITVVRMEVPCCGGITHAVMQALQNSGKMIPWQIVTVSTEGKILE